MDILDKNILDILSRLQKQAPTYLVGGYIRNMLCGIEPNDVDLATELSIEEVKKVIPNLSGTDKGLAFGIGRFRYFGLDFEVSTYEKGGFCAELHLRDFTINSLYHDGTSLYDPYGGVEDLKKKLIRSISNPELILPQKPENYLRAIRLSGQLCFNLDDKLSSYMAKNHHLFFSIDESRIQQEGWRIISSNYPLKAIRHLQDINLLPVENKFDPNEYIPFLSGDHYLRFCFLASIIGEKTAELLVDLFRLGKKFKEKLHFLSPYLHSSTLPEKPYVLNEVILLRRYQFRNEPERLKTFLLSLRK